MTDKSAGWSNIGKPIDEMKEESGYYWVCSWCGHENVGTESKCQRCFGVRKTA